MPVVGSGVVVVVPVVRNGALWWLVAERYGAGSWSWSVKVVVVFFDVDTLGSRALWLWC